MSEMREFLMELYLLHGEREFLCRGRPMCYQLRVHEFLVNEVTTRLTPKAIEYIKNLDNP